MHLLLQACLWERFLAPFPAPAAVALAASGGERLAPHCGDVALQPVQCRLEIIDRTDGLKHQHPSDRRHRQPALLRVRGELVELIVAEPDLEILGSWVAAGDLHVGWQRRVGVAGGLGVLCRLRFDCKQSLNLRSGRSVTSRSSIRTKFTNGRRQIPNRTALTPTPSVGVEPADHKLTAATSKPASDP